MPPGEAAQHLGVLPVGRPLVFRDVRGREPVDPAVGERHDAEPLSAPPALGRATGTGELGARGSHPAPRGVAGVAGRGPGPATRGRAVLFSPSASTTRSARSSPPLCRTRASSGPSSTSRTDVPVTTVPGTRAASSASWSAARCTACSGAPYRSGKRSARVRARNRPSRVRIPPPAEAPPGPAGRCTPRSRRAPIALGHRLIPAPSGSSAVARSRTSTDQPASCRPRAAARPPIPPPTTTARGQRSGSPTGQPRGALGDVGAAARRRPRVVDGAVARRPGRPPTQTSRTCRPPPDQTRCASRSSGSPDRLEDQVAGVDVHEVGAPPGRRAARGRAGRSRPRPRRWPARTPRRRSARSPTGPRSRASEAASRRSASRSRPSLDAGPSVPRPTRMPRSSMPRSGATPLASLALLAGQCATATSYSCQRSRSPSSMCTQCAASTRPPRTSWAASSAGTDRPCVGEQVGALGRGLGDVQVQQQAVLAGRGGRVAQHRQRHGVGGVRPDAVLDRAVVRRAGGQVDGGRSCSSNGRQARQRDQRGGDDGAGAGDADGGRDPLGVEVHLDAGGDAVAQHLRRRGGHRDLDVLGGEPRLARPHDLLQPAVQRQPLALAAEQHHRRVRVGVDQARASARRAARRPRRPRRGGASAAGPTQPIRPSRDVERRRRGRRCRRGPRPRRPGR